MSEFKFKTQIPSNRCFLNLNIKEFVDASPGELFSAIVKSYHGVSQTTSNEAWEGEIEILQTALAKWKDEPGHVIYEYDIPRLGKRIDVVVLLRGVVLCIEFKVGKADVHAADLDQVLDYALDLKNFHKESAERIIVPILVPSQYKKRSTTFQPSVYNDSIINTLVTGKKGLASLIDNILSFLKVVPDTTSFAHDWLRSAYAPTPSIIEAARTLYNNHSVEDITRHEADKASTDATIGDVLKIIKDTKERGEKSICFVTGVPGAGKTLVGLDVAVKQSYKDGEINTEDGAVYLSGNGPLVAVLTEALARDNHKKSTAAGLKKTKTDSRREVGKFIQVIHRYRDNMLAKIKTPVVDGRLEIDPQKASHQDDGSGYAEVEHVAIFDEAQRSWTHSRIANYLKRGGTYGNKLKVADFPMSEAEFLIWSLDQREDWAVIVCLVGGGQEINTGEGGIYEWIKALNTTFPHWNVYISSRLTEVEYADGRVNELLKDNPRVQVNDKLHLSVSMRSFRAERLSLFVEALLKFNRESKRLYSEIIDKKYPIFITRDIELARSWLRKMARGSERTGILVTKSAARFKPLAVGVLPNDDENAVHWFLEDKYDVRSSNFLEDAVTEIQVQGLELDYTCVLWDADMRCENNDWGFYNWEFHYFNGIDRWRKIGDNNTEKQKYMLNAYRVLLTRARQGMVICIPEGNNKTDAQQNPEDPTRLPKYYDSTYAYLKEIGIKELTEED